MCYRRKVVHEKDTILKIVPKPCFRKLTLQQQKELIQKLKTLCGNYLLFDPRDAFFEIRDTGIEFNVDIVYLDMLLVGAKLSKNNEIILIADTIREDKTYYLKVL